MDRFNQICLFIALLWLLITIPVGIKLRPTVNDFGQFYMSGVMVADGNWDSIYPIPKAGSPYNAGLNIHSLAKPKWRYEVWRHGVADYTHFILPPPSALLFVPFSLLSYAQAFWLWTFILIMCVWGVAIIAGYLLRSILRRESRWEGLLALLIVLSPMSARAIRIANVTPVIALTIGMVLLDLVRWHRPIRGAVALVAGAVLKYATLILAPLVLAMRRYRVILWMTGLGTVLLLLTLVIAGTGPFLEFYRSIMPTLSRPAPFPGNQSLSGLLVRTFGIHFSPMVSLLLSLARILSFFLMLGVLLTRRASFWQTPVHVFAGAALLLSWLFIFSPIAWEHWPIFFCPIWGWLLWEARRPGVPCVIALLSLLLMYFPAGIIQVRGIATYPVVFPEPFNSTQLAGVALLFCLAFWRLAKRTVMIRLRLFRRYWSNRFPSVRSGGGQPSILD